MLKEEKEAYEWAKNQQYQSVAARYARILANYTDKLEAQVKQLQIMVETAHQACSEMEVKLNKYKEREQSMIALWGEK